MSRYYIETAEHVMWWHILHPGYNIVHRSLLFRICEHGANLVPITVCGAAGVNSPPAMYRK